jgi:predicted type IV restriction endonuclease
MAIPTKISELVERFDRNLEAYKQGKYNETQVRLEFINPFFEELGWDITNKQGYAEAYKEVVNEDAIKVGGATKAPDYSFRIGGIRKFFLEAKKPSVDIKYDIHPAYQLRRYAWSAKLPLSILTDFEEFAVYDCRVKPVKTDKTSHSRILYLTWQNLLTKAGYLLTGEPATVVATLLTYAENNDTFRKPIYADELRRHLAALGIHPKNLAYDQRIAPALEELQRQFDESIRPRLIGGELISREETALLLDAFKEEMEVILHGTAGYGKSAVLYELTQ